MRDLYKAIDNLNKIISEESEVQLDEKLKPFQGSYNKKTQKLVNFTLPNGERKTFVAPLDYEKPKSKTNPSAKKAIDFINNLGKKVSDKGKELDPFYKKDDKPKAKIDKVKKKVLPPLEKEPMDIMGAGTKRKKVKATAANTKDYDKTLALQKSLIARGAKIDADGIMGPKTRAAMKQFMTPPVPKARPKTLPKSGGPDNRFVTGPELDISKPKQKGPFYAAPPERLDRPNNKFVTGPELDLPNKTTKVKPVTTPGPNTYRADAQGNYKKISPNAPQPQSKPGDSLITRIGKGFGKMGKDLSGFGKDVYNFADKYGIASNLERYRQKNQNKNKLASKESAQPKKSMIEQITGKNNA